MKRHEGGGKASRKKEQWANDVPKILHGLKWLEETNVERLTNGGDIGQCSFRGSRILHCRQYRSARGWLGNLARALGNRILEEKQDSFSFSGMLDVSAGSSAVT